MRDNKVKMPKKIHYSIPQVAEKLNCSINDVCHYAAIGALDICVYIHELKSDELLITASGAKGYKIEDISNGILADENDEKWIVCGVKPLEFDNQGLGLGATSISGFFYVVREYFTLAQFTGLEDSINCKLITTQSESGDLYGEYHIVLPNELSNIDTRFLCVMAEDLNKMRDAGDLTSYRVKNKGPTNKQISLFTCLLKMIPEFSVIDIENEKITKISAMIEAVAAKKGIELPPTHWQTWEKYLR